MFPLHIIVLIMVISVYITGGGERVRVEGGWGAWIVVGNVLVTHLFVALLGGQMCRRAAMRISVVEKGAGRIMSRLQRGIAILRWITIGLLAGQLWFGGWGALVLNSVEHGGWGLGKYRVFLLPDFLFLIAPLGTWILLWAGEYRAEVAMFSRRHAYDLARGVPTHYPPGVGAFVLMKMRHQLYLLVPVAITTVAESAAGIAEKNNAWLGWVIMGGAVFVLVPSLPWIVTRLWSTESMTGKLRERLEIAAKRHGIKFSNVLIWRTHFMVNNAAVLGVPLFSRYFLMTDKLMESLSDDQIESVFAHELGHAKLKHLWLYLVTIVGCMTLAVGLSFFAGLGIGTPPAWLQMSHEDLVGIVQLLMLAAFVIFLFAPVARRFENEADWFACKHMSQAETRFEMLESGALVKAPAGIVEGAEVFAMALTRVIEVANGDMHAGNWTHPAAATRVELVRTLAVNKEQLAAFEERRWWTRAWIVSLIVAGAAVLAAAIMVESGWKR